MIPLVDIYKKVVLKQCYSHSLMSYIFWQVKTTPHVSGSVNPVWESVVEFLVKDFTKVRDKHFSAREISSRYSNDKLSKFTCTCTQTQDLCCCFFPDQRFLSGV